MVATHLHTRRSSIVFNRVSNAIQPIWHRSTTLEATQDFEWKWSRHSVCSIPISIFISYACSMWSSWWELVFACVWIIKILHVFHVMRCILGKYKCDAFLKQMNQWMCRFGTTVFTNVFISNKKRIVILTSILRLDRVSHCVYVQKECERTKR